jgi:hypothetical protein
MDTIELYSNDSLKIIRSSENKHIYRIEFAYPSPILINSLIKTKLLRGATCTDDYKLLTFKAYSVQMFADLPKKSIYSVSNMVATLAVQLKYMYDIYFVTFIGFNTKNLIVIDDTKFLFLDGDLIKEIDEDTNTIMISGPFNRDDFFFSPEMENITNKELPVYLHYKTSYFSLGCLLFYALLTYELATTFYQDYLSEERIDDILNKYLITHTISFKETKLYWLICRCLVEEPEKRSIVFI